MKLTQEIKNELIDSPNHILPDKKSKYNSNLYMDKCSVCGTSSNSDFNLDTHHINHQKNCTNGFVNYKPHLPKNNKANLVVLCKKCHTAVHHNKIEINGYLDTSNGHILDLKYNLDI
jgi:5-methylcytosine-specific restriction endonuclease McrA